jgi:hypothetical protein
MQDLIDLEMIHMLVTTMWSVTYKERTRSWMTRPISSAYVHYNHFSDIQGARTWHFLTSSYGYHTMLAHRTIRKEYYKNRLNLHRAHQIRLITRRTAEAIGWIPTRHKARLTTERRRAVSILTVRSGTMQEGGSDGEEAEEGDPGIHFAPPNPSLRPCRPLRRDGRYV